MLLSHSSATLRKSNLGAMMKFQYEKGKGKVRPKILIISDVDELGDHLKEFYEIIWARNEPEVLRILSMVAFSASNKQGKQ